MITQKAWHNFSKFFAAYLVLLLVTTGCAKPPKSGTEPDTATGGKQNPLAEPVHPAYPGPYKTVVIDGVEYRQGRFPQGTYGGKLMQPIIASEPKTFNPWAANDTQSTKMCSYMWGSLLSVDPFNNEVIPDMASAFEVMPDHVTYVTHLRKGLKWSDGQPITAEDVAFTFNSIIAPGFGNASIRDGLSVDGKMPKVTVVDELTNKFVTAKPFVPFLRSIAGIPIAPKHIIEPKLEGKDARRRFDQMWSQNSADPKTLVTSGPFVLSRYVPSQRVEFVRTKNYYVVDPAGKQLPYLDQLVFLFVPDVSANLLKFKAGETDVFQPRNRDAVELSKQQKELNFSMYNLGQDVSSIFVMFNLNQRKNDKGKPYVEPYKSAWFNDVNFRQAINHAINRQQMIDGYLKGIGAPLFASESSTSPYFNAELKAVPQDLEYSKSLLVNAGFKMQPDGNLVDKDGHKVEFDVIAGAGGTMIETIAGYMQADFKKLGIKMNFQQQEFNSLIDKIQGQKNWEIGIFSLFGDPSEPNGGANVWKSDGRLHLFDIRDQNAAGTVTVPDVRPWEKRVDEIFNTAVQEFDPVKRKALYAEYQKIIFDQAPFVYLIAPMDMVAARNTVRNYVPTTNFVSQSSMGLHNIDEIYMDTTQSGPAAAPTTTTTTTTTSNTTTTTTTTAPAAPTSGTSAPSTTPPTTSTPAAPTTSTPTASTTGTAEPTTPAPTTSTPAASTTGTAEPTTSAPATSTPGTSAPKSTLPGTSTSETSAPTTSAPAATTTPGTTEPGAKKPASSHTGGH